MADEALRSARALFRTFGGSRRPHEDPVSIPREAGETTVRSRYERHTYMLNARVPGEYPFEHNFEHR